MNHDERAKKIEKCIEAVYGSLQSHLDFTHTIPKSAKKVENDFGSKKFHKECVKEYADIIKTLTELY